MSTSARPDDSGRSAPATQDAGAAPQEDAAKDAQAKAVCQNMGLNTFVLMSVFTQRIDVFMALKEFNGDILKVSLRLGALTAAGSVCELVANPFLGKISDTFGRRPLMAASPLANFIFKLLAFLHPSKFNLEMDKVIATTFSVIGGTTMMTASMSDLYPGNPTRSATATMTAGMYMALGIIAGPMFGLGVSKAFGSPRAAYLGSALMSVLQLSAVLRMQEPLAVEARRPFEVAGTNPLSFLKLFGGGRQLGTLALLGGVMQNIPEGKNLSDIHQTFSSSDVGMSETGRGAFVSFFGFCQVVGSIVGKKLAAVMGGQKFTSLATFSLSACMLWYSTVPVALRQSWPMFVGAVMQLFASSSPTYTKAVAAEYAKKAGWGMGEFQGAMANMRALTSATVPLILASLYAWSKRDGRNRPGLAYQWVAAMGLVTELIFRTLSPKDLALQG